MALMGSRYFSPSMTSKWMWLSSAHSQLTLPTLPMVCPAETVSPFFTLASVVPHCPYV